MAVSLTVQEFLRTANVPYTVFQHRLAYTAQEEAAATHTPGRAWAKTVVCFADAEPILAVVPADRELDLDRLRALVDADFIRLASEEELDWLFFDCDRGAMPPFGPLYRKRVFIDGLLATNLEVVFNAGTHIDAVCMGYPDLVAVTHATVGWFSCLIAEPERQAADTSLESSFEGSVH